MAKPRGLKKATPLRHTKSPDTCKSQDVPLLNVVVLVRVDSYHVGSLLLSAFG